MPKEEKGRRVNKTIRIDMDLDRKLKEEAHERWRSTGRKVYESDIIEEALRLYFKEKKG
ncbi:MAG: hypothetical protein ACU843_15195 [Gammaproteobacteria bacterium]